MSFFKPSVFIKAFLVSCVVFSSAFFSSCKDLAGFDPNVNGGRTVANNTFSAPTGLTATNGYKQKISLAWNPVSGARNYEIWCASSNTSSDDEWKIVQVTDKIQYDDKVSAGRTLYYRVRAVKATGVTSRYSGIVKGTSLAVPVISGGEVKDSSVTIQWFMENARGVDGKSNYEDELRFDVYCQKKDGGEPITKTFTATELNSEYKHTFENLAGTTNYQFWIEAYTTKDQSVEKSPEVDVNTLTSYTPLAPEFFATKGESAKGVRLYIYLPEMVMVNTETKASPNEKVDEPYPLYFKIYRKAGEDADGDYEEVCKNLYYNGSTTPPETSYYTSNPYKAGECIEWFDDSEKLTGGTKYTYKVRAFVDANYSKVVCDAGKEYQDQGVGTSETQAHTDTGWKSATPIFNVKEVDKTYSDGDEDKKVLTVKFEFSASWQDLGKAGDYKFAIKQHREPWDASSPGSDGDKDKWLEKRTGEYFFDTLDEVRSRTVKFGESGRLNAEEEGIYTYTLYIVRQKNGNNDVTISDVESDGENVVLDSVDAKDKALVTHEVNIPKPELTVKDGYTDHVYLIISGLKEKDKDATYTLIRTLIVDGRPESVEEITLEIPESAFSDGSSYEYDDDDNGNKLPGNQRYSYILKAAAESGAYSQTDSQDAETLGTPKVAFEMGKLAYDSITISFNGVLAADYYVVELGASEGFGNGDPFTITKDASASSDSKDKEGAESQDEKWSCDTDSKSGAVAKVVSFVANRFTVTIEKPYGYDNARLAGSSADLTVTAYSDVDEASSNAVPVNVVGPARVNARVGSSADATENSIWVAWDAVEGAKGYLIKRVMYDDVNMNEVSDASDATYYYDVSSGTLTLAEGGDSLGGRATVNRLENGFTLTDYYMEKDTNLGDDNVELANYQAAQSKIPWGLPFRYVVLPVLDKGDFEFGEESLALASGGKVEYQHFSEKQTEGTATFGYGLEVYAEKSKDTTIQKITWKKPFYADKCSSRVFRRTAGDSGIFERVKDGDVAAGLESFSYAPDGDEIYRAYEYIVKYNAYETVNLQASLDKEFEELKDAESEEEQSNKGYLFTVQDYNLKLLTISAAQGGSNEYAEHITWTVPTNIWDTNTRALGPTGIKLYIRNNNLDADWHPAASINSLDSSGKVTALGDDISADNYNNGISLYPTTCAGGESATTGLLKVLRDYKHYYAISLIRGEEEYEVETTNKYTPGFDDFASDKQVYAYRQITNEEMVRAATLAMSIGAEKATSWNYNLITKDSEYKESGTTVVKVSQSGGFGSSNLVWTLTYNNYTPTMVSKAGESVSFLTLNGVVKGETYQNNLGSGTTGNDKPPYEYHCYNNDKITVSAANGECKDLYSAEIKFYWLDYEVAPRYNDSEGYKGIKISHPSGNEEKVFGNITPLSFNKTNKNLSSDTIRNQNDTAEWQ